MQLSSPQIPDLLHHPVYRHTLRHKQLTFLNELEQRIGQQHVLTGQSMQQ